MSIIKSFSVGNGDMFYIKHDSNSFTIIDCCLNVDKKEGILHELKKESGEKRIKRFISTHPDDDHIRGLKYLNEKMGIVNFYCVANKVTKEDETDDFIAYCSLRNSDKSFHLEKDCRRKWLNESDQEIESAGITILWPDTTNEHYKNALEQTKKGNSPNNISPIIKYSLQGGATVLWMGDLETDFMESIEENISLEKVDILFAPHHGRKSGKLPKSWLRDLNPNIIVIGEAPSENINYEQEFNTIKQNSAGELLFKCTSKQVDIYCGSEFYKEDFLNNDRKEDNYGLYYLGTLNL